MPHPKLVNWAKMHRGQVSIGLGDDGTLHLLSDDPGRASLAELIAACGTLEFDSSIDVPLSTPAESAIDPWVVKKQPTWFAAAKLGSSNASEEVVLTLPGYGARRIGRSELFGLLSRPNLGNDEAKLCIPEPFWVW